MGDGMFLAQALGSSHLESGQVANFQSDSTSESDSDNSIVVELGNESNSPVENSGSENMVCASQSAGETSESRTEAVRQDKINSNGQLLYRLVRPVPPNVRKRRPVKLPAGPFTECAFARWPKVYHFLSRHSDVIASFSCRILLRPLLS